jgi:hypothetical protein
MATTRMTAVTWPRVGRGTSLTVATDVFPPSPPVTTVVPTGATRMVGGGVELMQVPVVASLLCCKSERLATRLFSSV